MIALGYCADCSFKQITSVVAVIITEQVSAVHCFTQLS